jgi:hypothetical protein
MSKPKKFPEKLLTVVEVAARKKTTESGIRDQIKRRVLPAVKVGHRVFVPEDALQRLDEMRATWSVSAEEAFHNINARKAAKRAVL